MTHRSKSSVYSVVFILVLTVFLACGRLEVNLQEPPPAASKVQARPDDKVTVKGKVNDADAKVTVTISDSSTGQIVNKDAINLDKQNKIFQADVPLMQVIPPEGVPLGSYRVRLDVRVPKTFWKSDTLWTHEFTAEKGITLQLTSTPPGAEVFINGELIGRTPVTTLLNRGSYQLKLTIEGYFPSEQSIQIMSNTFQPPHVNLRKRDSIEPDGIIVALQLTSTPPGAEVFIDGRPIGRTPVTSALNPGPYRVKLIKQGYLPDEQSISLVSNKHHHVDLVEPGNCEIMVKKGRELIDLNPDQAISIFTQVPKPEVWKEEIKPKDIDCYILAQSGIGYAYRKKGDYNRAVEAYQNAIEMQESNVYAHYWQGYSYYRLRNYSSAISSFGKVDATKEFLSPKDRLQILNWTHYYWALCLTEQANRTTNPAQIAMLKRQACIRWNIYLNIHEDDGKKYPSLQRYVDDAWVRFKGLGCED